MAPSLLAFNSLRAVIGAVVILVALASVSALSKTSGTDKLGLNKPSRGMLKNMMEQVKAWAALAEQDSHAAVALSHNSHAAATLRVMRRIAGDRQIAHASGFNPVAFAEALDAQQRGIFEAIGSACPPLQIPNRFVVASFPEQ